MKYSFFLISAVLSCLACTAISEDLEKGSTLNHVSIGVKDVDLSDLSPQTRSEIGITNTVTFAWSETDVVGMFPDKGAQAFFEMAGQDGETVAEFDGGGWALKSANEYAVYFPYSYDNKNKEAILFDYTGQTQDGNNDYAHLAEWQYMAQGMQEPDNDGACNYSMERIEAIVIFDLVFPVVVSCDKLVFRLADGHQVAVSTALDISGETYTINTTKESKQFTLQLENIATTESGQTLRFFAMMPPQDLSGKQVILSVHTTDGDNLLAAVNGKNMLHNHAYKYTATLTNDYASFMEKYGIIDGEW